MPCQLCNKKCGIPITCLYCGGLFCPRCTHLERHGCTGRDKKIQKDLTILEKKVEYVPSDKYNFL